MLEQVLGKTVSIQTKDGVLHTYELSTIEKVSKELDLSSARVRNKLWMNDYKTFQKGYVFEAESLMGGKGLGLRIYNGYKFNPYSVLSLGVGIEMQTLKAQQVAKTMLSLNIAYGGDFIKKRITPYYQIELGYAYVLNRKDLEIVKDYGNPVVEGSFAFDGFETVNYGGPMSATVFGVKLNTKKKIFYKFGFDYRLSSNFYDATPVHVNKNNEMTVIGKSFKDISMQSTFGFRFGIGF